MTLKEMRDLIRLRIDDVRGIDYTDSQLLTLIQAAHRKVYTDFIRHRIYFNVTTTTLTVSSQYTDLPNDLQKLLLVQFTDSKGSKYTVVTPEQGIQTALPTFFIAGEQLVYNQEVSDSFDVYITYVPKLTPIPSIGITDDYEIVQFPSQYQDLLVSWATVLALGKDEDNVQFWTSMYQKEFDDIVVIAKPENDDDNRVIDVSGELWR